MGLKAILSKPLAAVLAWHINYVRKNAVICQQRVFNILIRKASNTAFGRDHQFSLIVTYEDFKKQVPLSDYEQLKFYIERIKSGEEDVLWPGKPIYLSKTSGTTSGTKFIPITTESINNHINSARNALLMYIHETGKTSFLNGKLLFLSGSPKLTTIQGIKTGRLSGIVNHHIPAYLQNNQVPNLETNSIEDWENKIEAILTEILSSPLTLISGIPPWVQMFFDSIGHRTGKAVQEVFPELSVYVYGGVSYEPYQSRMENSMGPNIDTIETYPASEGFIAYQDTRKEPGMLLVVDDGIFYEFIPLDCLENSQESRIELKDVCCDVNYAIVLNTNAGLWGYVLGDTVKFTSIAPYRLTVTGRITHFISAFGEHVIAEEVDYAIRLVSAQMKAEVIEYTVAPQVNPEGELPYHEWFVEFGKLPVDIEAFRIAVDTVLQSKNSYYKDLIQGGILQNLKIKRMKKNAFISFMREEGKLGGQNKMPRLANNREIASKLAAYAY